MMYRLAILDIDGTLVNPQGYITEKTLEVLKQVQRTGAIVTLCTGRNIRNTLPIIKKTGITVPFSCIDGTLLYHPVEKRILKEYCLTNEEVQALLHIAASENVFVEASTATAYYKYIKTESLWQYDIYNQKGFLGRMKSRRKGVHYLSRLNQFEKVEGPIYQLAVAGQSAVLAQMKQRIRQEIKNIEIREHILPGFLFLNRPEVKKSNGMKMLCEYLQIDIQEVVAIGDEMNDIDMLEMAGLGIAMANSTERVKEAADEVTADNTQDGVALALKKYFL